MKKFSEWLKQEAILSVPKDLGEVINFKRQGNFFKMDYVKDGQKGYISVEPHFQIQAIGVVDELLKQRIYQIKNPETGAVLYHFVMTDEIAKKLLPNFYGSQTTQIPGSTQIGK